ncbi:MAG: efflux RND transporter permease subunit [Nitrospirae bacterium]|nr:efflux RND transporter permease subunit [Nitrospirota bacterium]
MDIIKYSIEKPAAVIVGVILVVLFGVIGFYKMPYQLTPTVTEPEIAVTTAWPGATPYEIEREIIEEQEKVLKGIPRLIEMESSSFNNVGTITLRFKVGTRVDDALLRVSNKLGEVRSYPENVEKPVINATGAATSPVIWIIFKSADGNPNPAYTYRTYFENEIRQYLERVEGVADLFIGGGIEKELHILVKPEKLGSYGLTINDLINVLGAENVNISSGSMGVGRRNYRIRTVAEFKSPEEIEGLVIRSSGQSRIFLKDVAGVSFGYSKLTNAMMHNAKDGIGIGIKPEPGTNILELTNRVEEVVKELNSVKLMPNKVYLEWVYDQRPYIQGAIGLVRQNILIGGALAIIVLLVFLWSISSTVVISTSIPISVIGTFIFMNAMGRNLNVVSLAGISFAVGMLVDNAIVVLENIDRHQKMGKSPAQSSYEGTKEVWGAILASTLTTVAVFLPVVFIEEEVGQLFKDIAIAVTFSIVLSLIVSVSVIPMLSKQLFTLGGERIPVGWNLLTDLGNRLMNAMMRLLNLAIRTKMSRLVTILLLTSFSVLSSFLLFPKMEYLPQGNRNLIINILVPPPGLSYEERKEIGNHIFGFVEPYFGKDNGGFPGIKNMFYVGAEQFMIFGAISTHEQRAGELVPLFMRVIHSIPGMLGISTQAGIFEARLGRGRTIDVDISGGDLNRLVHVAGSIFAMLVKEIPEAQMRPIPSLEILYPEVRIVPDRERLRASGMTARDFGIALDVLMDGRKIGDFKQEGEKKIDLVLKAPEKEISTPEELYKSLIATPGVAPVSSFSELVRTTGITEIRHLERQRTITLQVTPPMGLPLQEAMEILERKIIPALKDQGMLTGVDVRLSGAADKLTVMRKAMLWNFLLAVLITYLLMAALFENFIYPFIILFTVPMAAAGGLIGLKLVNLFIAVQPFDALTMLGFIILIGVVVNNAILIVHQSLNNIRYHDMNYQEAVLESTKTRLRPIYMTATTSVFGMLPLVVAPGPGSELYRGLGSVVLGGLALSTVFTVFVIPPMLMFFIGMEKKVIAVRIEKELP